MKKHLLLMFVAACVVGVTSDAHADDTFFAGWTVSINPAQSDASSASTRTVHERVYREVREVVNREYTGGGYGYRPYYWGGGSNFSYYFPWRNYRGSRGFTSYYRPRTIYNYGW